jgi:hypothetical protein
MCATTAPGKPLTGEQKFTLGSGGFTVQDCPKCGLVNPPDAQSCDCGYDFASRTMRSSYLGHEWTGATLAPTSLEIVVCLLFPVIGIILGLGALSRRRRPAGRTMLLISGGLLVIGFALLGVLELVK